MFFLMALHFGHSGVGVHPAGVFSPFHPSATSIRYQSLLIFLVDRRAGSTLLLEARAMEVLEDDELVSVGSSFSRLMTFLLGGILRARHPRFLHRLCEQNRGGAERGLQRTRCPPAR
eukprot:gnl/TRDRNA2_/TRDRNA2_161277_c0_seq1.p2 gnl/TRDRNA2_/TRDRNA2_161277_c0~~gnl/TRDRNA2_/TRDRNA2_161277_c0_seq1.p2  ORF type:complete len:117 (+),score=2.50 gnl/TRDRNA2_/TRDRNA2_161277_c0_seq1:320-670(+)